jgi:chemotaxis protein histidine kinase CheA
VYREAHTLKGGAAVVGLDDVLRVAHAMEEVLDGLRGGGGATTPAVVDTLLGAVDGIREMVPAVLAGDDRAAQADRLVAALHSPAAPTPEPVAPAVHIPRPEPAPAPDPPPAPAARRGRRRTIRLSVDRLDELVRLAGEASAAALRLGRLVTDRLGVEPAAVPELHELTPILEGCRSGPSRPAWSPSPPSPSRCAGPPAT